MPAQQTHNPAFVTGSIRPVVLCIFQHKDKILVKHVSRDPSTALPVYMPPGGGLIFGEYSWESIRIEIKKELGEEIKNLSFLGASEQVTHDQQVPKHEIVFLFKGELANEDAYHQDIFWGKDDTGQPLRAVWKPISFFKRNKGILYPDLILELV
ncbi:MAG: NUDIX domain-containing protein [Bacteroidota bacterium]